MAKLTEEHGTIVVLLETFRTQRLPRALDIKEQIDQGQRLTEYDITFLGKVLDDTKLMTSLLGRHPEYEDLAARVTHLYKEIVTQALVNEQNQ